MQPPIFAPSSMPLPTPTDDFMHADQAMTMECTYLRKAEGNALVVHENTIQYTIQLFSLTLEIQYSATPPKLWSQQIYSCVKPKFWSAFLNLNPGQKSVTITATVFPYRLKQCHAVRNLYGISAQWGWFRLSATCVLQWEMIIAMVPCDSISFDISLPYQAWFHHTRKCVQCAA